MEWTREANEDYSNLSSLYGQVQSQFTRYMGHVTKYVGGIMETPKMVEETGAVYEVVTEAKQKEAVDFLNKNLFTTPSWLINNDIFSRTGLSGVTVIGQPQDIMLGRLFGTRTLTKLIEAEASLGSQAYQITELFSDLKKGIWTELATKKRIDVYRRNLQKSYINILSNLLNPPGTPLPSGGFVISVTPTVSPDKSDIKKILLFKALKRVLTQTIYEARTDNSTNPEGHNGAVSGPIVHRSLPFFW